MIIISTSLDPIASTILIALSSPSLLHPQPKPNPSNHYSTTTNKQKGAFPEACWGGSQLLSNVMSLMLYLIKVTTMDESREFSSHLINMHVCTNVMGYE